MVSCNTVRYAYTVDAQDRLIWVSPAWLAFARENGAAQLTEESTLGKSLWSFIADEATCQLYQALMARIRERKSRMTLPFRCDSPSLRRYMWLALVAEDDGHLRLEGTLVKTEPREYVGLFDAHSRRNRQVLTMCSICQRVLIEPLGWIDIDDAVVQLNLLEGDPHPQLRYAICQACEEAAVAASS